MFPHLKALHFVMEHSRSIEYWGARPLSLQEPAFDVSVEDGKARFTMRDQHASKEEALAAVNEYIAGWEFEAVLEHGTAQFRLKCGSAGIEDRDPSTGKVSPRPKPTRYHISVGDDVQVSLGKARYPFPPTTAFALTPDARSMHGRYLGYREGREPLASMAFFCLTVLELPWRPDRGARKRVPNHYAVDETVLRELGRLTSTRGGVGARKAQGRAPGVHERGESFPRRGRQGDHPTCSRGGPQPECSPVAHHDVRAASNLASPPCKVTILRSGHRVFARDDSSDR